MKFIEKIAAHAKRLAGDQKVSAVYIGLSYCCAELENGSSGLAFVFKEAHSAGCNIDLPLRPLAGASARTLLDFAGRGSLANSVCLAVANAVLTPLVNPDTRGDFIEHFRLAPDTRVSMVGHFKPLVPLIRDSGADLTIFDLDPDGGPGILQPEEIPRVLPGCEVGLVTATAIINETIDDIFCHGRNLAYFALVGPSAPLAPEVYEGTPVSCASGAVVRDRDKMRNAVMEAGGMRVFSPYLDKVNVYLGRAG